MKVQGVLKKTLAFAVVGLTLLCSGNVAFASSGSASNATVSQPVYGMVNVEQALYLRSAPSTSASILGSFTSGTYLMIVGSSGDFYRVQYSTYGQSYGYVAKQYVIDLSSACPGYATANVSSSLNVRAGSSASTAIVGAMANGNVAPLASDVLYDSWDFIVWGNVRGYVSDYYVTIGWY